MATKKVEENLEDKYLPNKKVILMPTPRRGQLINDPKHKMFFMAENSTITWRLPKYSRTNTYVDIFESKEEREFFEKALGEDLNPHKKQDNYWATFKVSITKKPEIVLQGVLFDLSDPVQNLQVKVLKHQVEIAPTWDKAKKRPEYRWALKDETQDIVDNSNDAEDLTKAYVHFSQIQKSEKEMIKFLKIYGASNKLNNNVPEEAKKSFLIGEIQGIIKHDLKRYLNIIEDGNWDIKVFLEDAVSCGAITKSGKNYMLANGDPIQPLDGSYLATVAELSKWEDDQDERYMLIKARIENTK